MTLSDRKIKSEEKMSKHINIVGHYNDDTLIDKSGKLIKIIKLAGVDFVTKDDLTLSTLKNNRNNLLKNFTSEFALYFWHIRSKSLHYPEGQFQNSFANAVNEKYLNGMQQMEMFHTELYLAIMTKPPAGLVNKSFNILKQFSLIVDKKLKQNYLFKCSQALDEMTRKVMSSLIDYQPRLLSIYHKNNKLFSEPMEFLSRLINFENYSVPFNIVSAGEVLPRKRIFFNRKAGVLELRIADNQRKFAAVLSIKGYQPITYPGMLDVFSSLKIEYVITQSFRFYDKQVAKTKLRDQQKEMLQSQEESLRQTEQIDDVFDETASGEVGYGAHHFTLVCYADSQEELNKHVALLIARFSDIDVTCIREDIASECAFWAQLPGNFSYILRAADISTKNMASFASFHNYSEGKMSGNHWGPAITVFETLSGSPYYFNFHYKDVGNFLVFGSMGSGKTVLVEFLILQSMKFGGKRIIFDKDRGLEILVRAMGGVYEILRPGIATGFNPCQLDDTPENRKFLHMLFKKLLTVNNETFAESDSSLIDHAIDGMYRLEDTDRQLCNIASFFGVKKKNSLRNRFDQWHSEGAYAWAFDNKEDHLNLDPDVVGFDLSHILSDPDCKTPLLMYLTYRVENALQGNRGILFCDEGWHALGDPYFRSMMDDWSRTPRKKNNIFGLATQVANDTVHAEISKSITESSFCHIFFPNHAADSKVYKEIFGLSKYEYKLIKTLPDDQHYFLLKHGRSANRESVVIRANLSNLEDEIAIISARESTLALLDQIRAEVGDDPTIWLPIFHQRRKTRSE